MKLRALVAMVLIGILSADTWAGEIMVVGGTPKTVRSGNRTYVVPGADTISDYSLGISGQIQKADGLWVTGVEKNTPAAQLGLKTSDWILALNGQKVTAQNWDQIMSKGGKVRFVIKDGKTGRTETRDVTIKPQK